MANITDAIVALEKRFWTEADKPETFGELAAEEALMVIEPMGVIEKHQAMQMPAEKPWIDVEMTDIHVRQLSPELVVLAYHGRGRHEGDEEPFMGSIASVYFKRDGRWQLAMTAHQPWKPQS